MHLLFATRIGLVESDAMTVSKVEKQREKDVVPGGVVADTSTSLPKDEGVIVDDLITS